MISLCMIIKNEESVLKKCLESIYGFVDEIVIVDTGSEDNSIEIAKNYTDKIFNFKWNNDFSAARNFSIAKASNDWVLVLDADEVVRNFNRKRVLEFCINTEAVGRILINNYYEDKFGEKKYIDKVSRFFNKNLFEYEGIIHEQITKKDRSGYKTRKIDIEVNHVGYTKNVINKTNKIDRNIKLLKEAIKNNSQDAYIYYQLGKSYFMGKSYLKAYESFKKALELVHKFEYEYVSDLIETYGYTMIELELYEKALELYSYEKYYNTADFNFLMAHIEMNNGNFQKAAERFLKCTEFRSGKIEGITTYLPLYNIGVIFECLGFIEKAMEYFELCGEYKVSKERLDRYKKL